MNPLPDIVLKNRDGSETEYFDTDSVELLGTDGNPVEYYQGSKFDDYYTKQQTDRLIGKTLTTAQPDWDCYDAGNSRYIRNRTHYDSRQAAVSFVVDAETGDEVTFDGQKFRKIADKPLTSLTELAGISVNDRSSLKLLYADTKVTLTATDGTVYSLNWYIAAVLMNALAGNLPAGHIYSAWAYVPSFETIKDGENQNFISNDKTSVIALLFVQEGSTLTKNEDGTVATLDAGTYVRWEKDSSTTGWDGATATITYGALKQLDPKYIDMTGYYTKAQVDALVKAQVAAAVKAVLPPYTSADNGKVLGIKNGALAWVTVGTPTPDPNPEEGQTVTLESVASAIQSGDYVTIT